MNKRHVLTAAVAGAIVAVAAGAFAMGASTSSGGHGSPAIHLSGGTVTTDPNTTSSTTSTTAAPVPGANWSPPTTLPDGSQLQRGVTPPSQASAQAPRQPQSFAPTVDPTPRQYDPTPQDAPPQQPGTSAPVAPPPNSPVLYGPHDPRRGTPVPPDQLHGTPQG